MKIQVGIISHKPGKLFERCIQGLIQVDAGVDYELLLQLTSGTCAENWNRLYRRMDSDFLCVLEDDTAAIRPMWLKSLVSTMKMYPQCGIVMPIETKDGEHADPGFVPWLNKTIPVAQVFGFCNLIRKGVKLEADEKLTYFNDIDLGYQAQAQGWQTLCNGHVWMLHGGDEKRLSNAQDIEIFQVKDMQYMAHKWPVQGERSDG